MADDQRNQRIARLTPLDEVLAATCALVVPVPAARVARAAALGRVVAEDVPGLAAMPAAPLALRDGFAVWADDIADAGPYAPMPLPVPHRVEAGDRLPDGADAVLLLDAAADVAGQPAATAACAPGEGVLAAGADLAAGRRLAGRGRRLNALDLVLLAVAGVPEVAVREPRLCLVARRCDDPIAAAAVEMLQRLLTAAGCRVRGHADLAAALAGTEDDAVVAVGGTGSGRRDDSVLALARHGRVLAHGIAIAPGETTAVGVAGERPVLLLPGRIDAALAAWLTIGAPIVDRLSGCETLPATTTAALTRKVSSPIGLAEVVPVHVNGGRAEPIASGYWPLGALSRANGWLLVPAASEGFPASSEVVIRPWP